MTKLPVLFKKFPDGDVIALFPTMITYASDHQHQIMSYMHIGQHSDADPVLASELEDALASEYEPLLKELTQVVGYEDLVITKACLTPRQQERVHQYAERIKSSDGSLPADFSMITDRNEILSRDEVIAYASQYPQEQKSPELTAKMGL